MPKRITKIELFELSDLLKAAKTNARSLNISKFSLRQ